MRVVCGALLLTLSVCAPWSGAQPAMKTPSSASKTVGGKSLGDWIKELTNADASKRAEAVIAITYFDDENARAVPHLLTVATRDRDVSPRVRAVIALRMVAVTDNDMRSVINTLAGRLDPARESQAIARLEAAVSLRRFATEPGMALIVADLARGALDSSSWEIRHHCVGTLWRVGREQKSGTDDRIYETLLSALGRRGQAYQVRLEALHGLGALGRPKSPMVLAKVVTTLESCARSENKALAIWAYTALVAMQEGEAGRGPLAKIAHFLKSDRLETRIQAAHALGALSARAKSKVPLLVAMLKDPETNAVWAACSALAGIGEASDRVVDALLELVDHKEAARSAAGVTALVVLRVNTTRVTGAFDRMLDRKELDVQLRGLIEAGLKELKKPRK